MLCILLLFLSCSGKSRIIYLVYGEQEGEVALATISDLQIDLSKVVEKEVRIISEKIPLPKDGIFFILGTAESNQLISDLIKEGTLSLSKENPGPRGGIWDKANLVNGQKAIILAGSNVQGLQYAIYDYAKEILGIDPLEYWTGKKPDINNNIDLFDFDNRTINPPKVPILSYFENDVDELANYRGKLLEYDWESYTEMINSLVRLRYNSIQIYDMLGRPEFFIRPEYKTLKPDYQVDITYVDKMVDYAHKKGLSISFDFALGYQFHPMSADKANCWKDYKEDWIAAWRYYLEKTPLRKTDIFMLRPRHQVWDWEYESTCGEDKITVFNEVYAALGELVNEYNPKAQKVLICYSDGMEMWNEGFRPPKDWIVGWADDGFGDFEHLPETTDGYKFGTYMHAGFWLNHTVHNPYPEKVESKMKQMFQDFGADEYCLVNGQNFRPFLLNLEAYSKVCHDPETFNAEQFYKEWSQRYFNKDAAVSAVKSMKLLNKAQSVDRIGYVQHLWEIREAIAYLSNSPIARPGKPPVAYEFERVENDIENVRQVKKYIDASLAEAQKGIENNTSNDEFYYSYIYLPVVLYNDLITFEMTLHDMSLLKREFETNGDMKSLQKAIRLLKDLESQLIELYNTRIVGDKNPKWSEWYNPKIRRPNNGFPTMEMLNAIADNLNQMTKL